MASGFIEIDENKEFSVRWTAYDMILNLLINELNQEQDVDANIVSSFLQSYTPPRNFDESLEMGWGFVTENDIVDRIVPLSELNEQQRKIFWKTVETIYSKLQKKGKSYSTLPHMLLKELLDLQ
ncbi:hypothetical protein ACE193_05635 [Bernardetia sp. OM2101]|uniref:hypothetical protein n=1 Tax=Bernardetia sp. OM2101 TaxID=3344876 RepID=UPI0035D102E6